MTHLEQYKAFLDAVGVPYTEEPEPAGPDGEERVGIGVDDNTGPDVRWTGYGGFCFSFIFDKNTGAVVEVGAWE